MADASAKKPYGDVSYADPGYQGDGVKRYPLDSEEHVRAAWSYINMPKNASKYSADQLANIKGRIRAAAKKYGIEISDDSSGRSFAPDSGDSFRSVVLALQEGNGRTLSGLAVPYGEFAEIKDRRGHYQEMIVPGAFHEAVGSTRPKMLFEHGQDVRTGRTPIGKFDRVWEEGDGVHVSGQLFENQLVQPLIDAARAGELSQWSVHFRTPDDGSWEDWSRHKGWDIRKVNRALLPEISLVNFGAYQTTVSVRSLDQLTGRSDAGSEDGGEPAENDAAAEKLLAARIRDRVWRMRKIRIG